MIKRVYTSSSILYNIILMIYNKCSSQCYCLDNIHLINIKFDVIKEICKNGLCDTKYNEKLYEIVLDNYSSENSIYIKDIIQYFIQHNLEPKYNILDDLLEKCNQEDIIYIINKYNLKLDKSNIMTLNKLRNNNFNYSLIENKLIINQEDVINYIIRMCINNSFCRAVLNNKIKINQEHTTHLFKKYRSFLRDFPTKLKLFFDTLMEYGYQPSLEDLAYLIDYKVELDFANNYEFDINQFYKCYKLDWYPYNIAHKTYFTQELIWLVLKDKDSLINKYKTIKDILNRNTNLRTTLEMKEYVKTQFEYSPEKSEFVALIDTYLKN